MLVFAGGCAFAGSKRVGDAGYRSLYLSHAERALYHLSYTPILSSVRVSGLVVEWLPATESARVRFPAHAHFRENVPPPGIEPGSPG